MDTEHPAAPSDLDAFIRTAKAGTVPDEALVSLLRQNGWSERRIYRSLSAYYVEALGIAPPSRSARGENSRDAFLYLLNFITLGFWTIALGNLLDVLIGRAYPSTVVSYIHGSLVYELALQLATIIVALPAFVFINSIISRELKRRPDFFESGVRLWLTYIALVVAAIVVLVDGIWFLNTFLRGEITIKFVLDSLVLAVLGGGVFGYYFAGLNAPKADA
jgi:Domain of unknown function (DUF5671)